MRGSIRQLAWRIPEGVYHRALKAEAEVAEGNLNDLLWDLLLYRYAMQRVADALWDLDRVPSKAQAHRMFYNAFEELRFQSSCS
jgi:putative transposase